LPASGRALIVVAANIADARVEALLLLAGFVGQLIGAVRSDWSFTVAVIAYVVAALLVAAGLVALPRLRTKREREIFMAHLDRTTNGAPDPDEAAKNRSQILEAYGHRFGERKRSRSQVEVWLREWESHHS